MEPAKELRRAQLEHVLRAASRIVGVRDLLVIGSQSILATYEESRLPLAAVRSIEVDVATLDGDEAKSDQIDGAIGEGSQFHEEFGIYAQGVGLATAVLPRGWRDRLVVLENDQTRPGRGLCLEPHDCVVSKMVAGRQKDYDFANALLRAGVVDPKTLRARIDLLERPESEKARLREWLGGTEPRTLR